MKGGEARSDGGKPLPEGDLEGEQWAAMGWGTRVVGWPGWVGGVVPGD